MSMEEKLIKTPELEIRVLTNGIHIYKLTDWSEGGLEQWEASINSRLDHATERVLSIYDMRHLNTVSRRGFAVVNRISTHPNIDLAYSAAVIKSRRVSILVNTMTQMRRNNEHSRIFSDLDKAINWVKLKSKASFELKRSKI